MEGETAWGSGGEPFGRLRVDILRRMSRAVVGRLGGGLGLVLGKAGGSFLERGV